jgi:hypothetical protein
MRRLGYAPNFAGEDLTAARQHGRAEREEAQRLDDHFIKGIIPSRQVSPRAARWLPAIRG